MLDGQYSDREAQQHQWDLYYNTGNPGANYGRDGQSRINVNLPYSSQMGGGSLNNVPSSFHVSYGRVPNQSRLTNPQGYKHRHSQAQHKLHKSNLLAGNQLYLQNLLQAALDQSAMAELLSGCALQLPLGSSPNPGGNGRRANDDRIKSSRVLRRRLCQTGARRHFEKIGSKVEGVTQVLDDPNTLWV